MGAGLGDERYVWVTWVTAVLLPLLLYFGLVFLPKAGAVRLLALATLAMGALWLSYFIIPGGTTATVVDHGVTWLVTLTAFTVALGLGGTMMAMKSRLPDHWPSWSWPVCAILALGAVALPALRIFGV